MRTAREGRSRLPVQLRLAKAADDKSEAMVVLDVLLLRLLFLLFPAGNKTLASFLLREDQRGIASHST
jgi:hypothetical protein